MTISSFIFGGAPTKVSIANELVLDAAISVRPSRRARPTKFPVESSGNITDHVIIDNLVLDIEGVIAEYPFNLLADVLALTSAIGTTVGGVGALVGAAAAINVGQRLAGGSGTLTRELIKNRNQFDTNYPKKAWDYLLQVQYDRIPFKVITNFREYEDMVITNLEPRHSSRDGKSLRFSMTCEQIQIVETELVALSEDTIDQLAAASAASAQNTGKQAAKAASESSGDNASILFTLIYGG